MWTTSDHELRSHHVPINKILIKLQSIHDVGDDALSCTATTALDYSTCKIPVNN